MSISALDRYCAFISKIAKTAGPAEVGTLSSTTLSNLEMDSPRRSEEASEGSPSHEVVPGSSSTETSFFPSLARVNDALPTVLTADAKLSLSPPQANSTHNAELSCCQREANSRNSDKRIDRIVFLLTIGP